jgi:hypothetical protein
MGHHMLSTALLNATAELLLLFFEYKKDAKESLR